MRMNNARGSFTSIVYHNGDISHFEVFFCIGINGVMNGNILTELVCYHC